MRNLKTQTLSKFEKIEGTPDVATPGTTLLAPANDSLLGLEPSISDDKEEVVIPTTAKTLTKEASLLGVESVEISYGVLCRSAGGVIPPEMDRLLRAGSTQVTAFTKATQLAVVVAGTFLHLETLSFAPSGATARCIGDQVCGAGRTIWWEVLTGTPVDTDTITGGTSAASCTITGDSINAAGGWKYVPDSTVASFVTHGAWSGATPAAGEVVRKKTTHDKWGVVISSTATSTVYEAVEGNFLNTEIMERATGTATEATLSADPILSRTPTTSEEYRQDGMVTQAWGCRHDWALNLASGQPARFDTTARGLFGMRINGALGSPPTTVAGALQFRNARVRFARALAATPIDRTFRIGGMSLSMGNSVNVRTDPGPASGAVSYDIGDRTPTLTIDPEMVVPDVYDFYDKWRQRTLIGIYADFWDGTNDASRISLWVPKAQFTNIAGGDRDGRLTSDLTCKLTKDSAGDDEFAIYVHG